MIKPDDSPEAFVERLFCELGLSTAHGPKVSRFSSTDPKDVQWRVEMARIDSAIEGMQRDPDLAAYVDGMKAAGLSVERQIERLTVVNLDDIRGLHTDDNRSPEAIARRRKATDQARAANMRQGYIHDAFLEETTERYVLGEITHDEYRACLIPPK